MITLRFTDPKYAEYEDLANRVLVSELWSCWHSALMVDQMWEIAYVIHEEEP